MRVAVLSNSDTAGLRVAAETWTARVRAALEDEDPGLEFVEIPFAPLGADPAAYAGSRVGTLAPEVVVVPIGSYAFAIGFVSRRVERLFGKRIAARYRRAEYMFDARTRRHGSLLGGLNRTARGLARRMVGTEAMASVESVTAVYEAVFLRLARLEEATVVVVRYPDIEGGGRRRRREQDWCHNRLEAAARLHHFGWVDGRSAVAGLAPGEAITPDGFHMSAAGHAVLGAAVTAAIRQALPADVG